MTSDFRSDTVTKPGEAMREAMRTAEVGDDVLDGDPTVRRLEEQLAAWLGKEGALFVPSGTMANQVALGAWTQPGDEIVVQRWAHVTTFEGGASGYLHGLQSITLGDLSGSMPPAEVEAAVRPDFIHCPRTALICVEQTHNVAGGRVIPLEELDAISAIAKDAGIRTHMDGARLWNAVIASDIPADRWVRDYDSVSLCLSKGLGAPVGSVIAGDAQFLERARLVRKRLGGWMRQAGILAAAGIYAFEHQFERLAQDHELAANLALRLDAFCALTCDASSVDTNIVMVNVAGWDGASGDAASLGSALAEEGVQVMAMGQNILRFVTSLAVGPADLDRLEAALAQILPS